MKNKDKSPAPLPVVKRSVKHDFSKDETAVLYVDFRQAHRNVAAAESDFESVKAQHKARIAEAEAKMGTLDAKLQAGFEMRDKECWVLYRTADHKKDFYVVPEFTRDPASPRHIRCKAEGLSIAVEFLKMFPEVKPILTEDMTAEDYEQDLLAADSEFESRSDIELWAADTDHGKIVVGKLRGKWYSAVRGNVGGQRVNERLDSEQKCHKLREDAVGVAGKRAMDWLEASLGKDAAKGFADGILAALKNEVGKVE
jgi:hypothetical protein